MTNEDLLLKLTEIAEGYDSRIDELEEKNRVLHARLKSISDHSLWEWCIPIEDDGKKLEWAQLDFPVPRLQITVMPKGKTEYVTRYDLIRKHFLGHLAVTPLGMARTYGMMQAGDFPRRYAIDMAHDSKHLDLPRFAVWVDVGENVRDQQELLDE